MKEKSLKNSKNLPSKIATTALMSALLVCAKLVLSFIPNIELVTLLTIVFAYSFGYRTAVATFAFCTLDIVLYPTSPDVIVAYYIYWNMLSITVATIRTKVTSPAFYIALAVLFTFVFGIISTATYSLFYGVSFFTWYAAGLVYFAIHIASSLVTVAVGFIPLTRVLTNIKKRLEPNIVN